MKTMMMMISNSVLSLSRSKPKSQNSAKMNQPKKIHHQKLNTSPNKRLKLLNNNLSPNIRQESLENLVKITRTMRATSSATSTAATTEEVSL